MNRAFLLRHMFPGIVIGPGGEGEECVLGESGIAEWNRPEKQPTDDELKAVEAAALAAQQAQAVKVAESTTARDEAKQAYSAIEPLRSHKDPAIALIADVMCKHLLATLGR